MSDLILSTASLLFASRFVFQLLLKRTTGLVPSARGRLSAGEFRGTQAVFKNAAIIRTGAVLIEAPRR
jgi:hypothetical protein